MIKNTTQSKSEEFEAEIFKERLNKLLKEHEIITTRKKEQFCEEIEISFTTLKKYTSKKSKIKNPDISTLIKIVSRFGISLDYLLGLVNEKENN